MADLYRRGKPLVPHQRSITPVINAELAAIEAAFGSAQTQFDEVAQAIEQVKVVADNSASKDDIEGVVAIVPTAQQIASQIDAQVAEITTRVGSLESWQEEGVEATKILGKIQASQVQIKVLDELGGLVGESVDWANLAPGVASRITTVENGNELLTQKIETIVAASTGDMEQVLAAIQLEQTARIAADNAESLSRTQLAAEVAGNKSSADQSIAALNTAAQAEAQARLALASTVAENEAAATTRMNTLANDVQAVGQSVTTLGAKVDGNKATYDATVQALADKDSALTTQLNTISATVTGNKTTTDAAISSANQARADGDSANAAAISSVAARMNTGGDIAAAITAAATAASQAQVTADGKASAASVSVLQATADAKSQMVFVPGDRSRFYPVKVSLRAQELPGADASGALFDFVVRRGAVHQDEAWLSSYAARVVAQASSWGNTPGRVFEVSQTTGGGSYRWGLGNVDAAMGDTSVVIWLRGGMSHTVFVDQPTTGVFFTLPSGDGTLTDPMRGVLLSIAEADAACGWHLNETWCPDANIGTDSVKGLPQLVSDVSATINRVSQVETNVAGKASASEVAVISAKVDSNSASITTISSVAIDAQNKVNAKFGAVLDVNGKLSGFQSTNDGTISDFVITSNNLLVTAGGTALNVDPNFKDPTAWEFGDHGSMPTFWSNATDTGVYSGAAGSIQSAKAVQIDSSKSYKVSVSILVPAGGSQTGYVRFYRPRDGAQITIGAEGFSPTIDGTWHTYTWVVAGATVNAGGSSFELLKLRFIFAWYEGSAQAWYMKNLRVEEQVDANMIVDGAITTNKLSAGAVTADKVAANSITASHLQASSITADKLAVTSLSAVSANLGYVVAGCVRSTDWNRYVDLTGEQDYFIYAPGFEVGHDGAAWARQMSLYQGYLQNGNGANFLNLNIDGSSAATALQLGGGAFRVLGNGSLYATSAYIRGDVQATSLTADTVTTGNIIGGAVSAVAWANSNIASNVCSVQVTPSYAEGWRVGNVHLSVARLLLQASCTLPSTTPVRIWAVRGLVSTSEVESLIPYLFTDALPGWSSISAQLYAETIVGGVTHGISLVHTIAADMVASPYTYIFAGQNPNARRMVMTATEFKR